ncbi:MAG TPA: lysine--tRNA ligase [Mycobacteriales bacterium]|nr:lysine--tRNA ligase [Mycobacteriales bacterium]
MRVRREKLDRLRAAGTEAYPVGVPRTHTLAEIRAAHPDLPPDISTGEQVGIAGRVIFIRNTGKLCFATLREGAGTELQAMLSLDKVGAESLAAWKADIDLGDHVYIHGEVITSRRGELSVLADAWTLASKALRPLPVAHKPMSEETRVRQRYVDLIVRPEARRMVDMRAAVVMSLRDTLARRGYTEVETPMLQATNGGATARPFSTHFNAFDIDVYLRIALELPLKRCVVGGIERVYEIGRVLRNEGADSTHSPEFAMLETYEAYADYNTMATLTQDLYQNAARAVFGSTTVQQFDGTEVDLGGDWSQLSLYELVSEAVGEAITPETSLEALREQAEKHDIPVNPAWVAGKIVEELFESLCEEKLDGPVFIRDFPIDTSPLTRQHRTRAGVAEKWDLYIGRVERGTAYSELVDPVIERERLVAQSLAAANGDPEAMQLDEDFLRALEYGMPPTGGMGLGIDRMMQVFTGRGIRETLLFPFVRPE